MTFNLRGKNFFFTYPQYDGSIELIRDTLVQLFASLGRVVGKYIIASERHEDGNLHRHCYIGLDDEVRESRCPAGKFDIGGNHPNIQTCRSTEKVIRYVVKDEDYITNIPYEVARAKGALAKKSRREIGAELIEGKAIDEIVKENPNLIFGFSNLYKDLQTWYLHTYKPESLDGPVGIWIGGISKSGKTTIAETKFGELYDKDNSIWFTGYDEKNHAGIKLDDVDRTWKDTFWSLKSWSHQFPFSARFHGGMFKIRPKLVVVTSNFTIDELCQQFGIADSTPWTRRFEQFWLRHWDDWVGLADGRFV